MPPGVSAEMSNVLRSSSRRTRKSRLGAEKSNPRDKRDLLDHRTACKAHFTLRKQDFKSDSLPLQNILGKLKIQIEKARCVAQSLVFRELTGRKLFCATGGALKSKEKLKSNLMSVNFKLIIIISAISFSIHKHDTYMPYDICYMIFAL